MKAPNRLTTGKIAERLMISRMHAWRLAKSGAIPCTRKTKGGQFYFEDRLPLRVWLSKMDVESHRKQVLDVAASKGYRKAKPEPRKQKQMRHEVNLWSELVVKTNTLESIIDALQSKKAMAKWNDGELYLFVREIRSIADTYQTAVQLLKSSTKKPLPAWTTPIRESPR